MLKLLRCLQIMVHPGTWSFFKKIRKFFKADRTFGITKLITSSLHFIKHDKIVPFEGTFILNTFIPRFPSKPFETFVTAVKSKENPFRDLAYNKRTAPISMYLSLTKNCSMNCRHCSASRETGPDLTGAEWIRIIKDLQHMGTAIIGFTGGEPLLRKDILEIIEAVDQRSQTILFTNGELLTAYLAQKLKASGLFGIGISLDSPYREEHDKNREKPGSFQKAVEALKTARLAGLYVMVQTMIKKESLEKNWIRDLLKTAKSTGAHEVKILEPILSGKLAGKQEFFLGPRERAWLLKTQKNFNKKPFWPKLTVFSDTESAERFGCGAGTQHSYISSDGNLFPCDFLPLQFGNLKEKRIYEVWEKMRDHIGKPHLSCLANKVGQHLGADPLPPEASCKIISENQSDDFPGFYKAIQ